MMDSSILEAGYSLRVSLDYNYNGTNLNEALHWTVEKSWLDLYLYHGNDDRKRSENINMSCQYHLPLESRKTPLFDSNKLQELDVEDILQMNLGISP